jgi:hypothetical protein
MPPAVDAAPQASTTGNTGRRPPIRPSWVRISLSDVVMWCQSHKRLRVAGLMVHNMTTWGSRRKPASSRAACDRATKHTTLLDATGACGPPAAETHGRRKHDHHHLTDAGGTWRSERSDQEPRSGLQPDRAGVPRADRAAALRGADLGAAGTSRLPAAATPAR